MVLGKDGEDQLDRSCEKRSVASSKGGQENLIYDVLKTEEDGIGQVLCMICLLKHIIKGKIGAMRR